MGVFDGEGRWMGLTITLSASEIRAFTSGANSAKISSIWSFRSGSSALGWVMHSGKAATTFNSWFFLCEGLAQYIRNCWTAYPFTCRHG